MSGHDGENDRVSAPWWDLSVFIPEVQNQLVQFSRGKTDDSDASHRDRASKMRVRKKERVAGRAAGCRREATRRSRALTREPHRHRVSFEQTKYVEATAISCGAHNMACLRYLCTSSQIIRTHQAENISCTTDEVRHYCTVCSKVIYIVTYYFLAMHDTDDRLDAALRHMSHFHKD